MGKDKARISLKSHLAQMTMNIFHIIVKTKEFNPDTCN